MTVTRYAGIYGALAGAVIIALILATHQLHDKVAFTATMWFGYLVMTVVMAPFIFVGTKQYRDVERGGVIGFWRALGVGFAIAAVATLAYALIWEGYLALTGYRFLHDMIAAEMAKLRAAGASAAALAAKRAEFDGYLAMYRDWYMRLAITAMEISPVAVVLPVLTGAVLRNPRVLPAG